MLLAFAIIVLEMVFSYLLARIADSVLVPIAAFAIFWLLMICCGIMRIDVEGRAIDKISNGIFLVTIVFAPVVLGAYSVL